MNEIKVSINCNGIQMYFPRKSLSKYLITDTIDFNKYVHDIDIFINDKCYIVLHFILKCDQTNLFPVPSIQGSCGRAIRAKKSPCEGWLLFLVGQKRSSSHLVILKSRPMSPPAYFLHLSFMKMSISCTYLLKSIVSVIKYFESDFLGKYICARIALPHEPWIEGTGNKFVWSHFKIKCNTM
jgi:hypothetical protein